MTSSNNNDSDIDKLCYESIIMVPVLKENETLSISCNEEGCEITLLDNIGQTLGKQIYKNQEKVCPFPPNTFQIRIKYQGDEFHLCKTVLEEKLNFDDTEEELKELPHEETFIPEPCLLGNHLGEIYRMLRTLRDGTRMGVCSQCCPSVTNGRRNALRKTKMITTEKISIIY